MTLKPQFLPVGSIVEYNISEHETPEWTPTILDAVDLQWLNGDSDGFNLWHRPIPLTPEILVEWCGFEKCTEWDNTFNTRIEVLNGFKNISIDIRANVLEIDSSEVVIHYLHELQLLFLGFKTVLPITIK
jgi:hypothetical protein